MMIEMSNLRRQVSSEETKTSVLADSHRTMLEELKSDLYKKNFEINDLSKLNKELNDVKFANAITME